MILRRGKQFRVEVRFGVRVSAWFSARVWVRVRVSFG
jgi:hypothetical protein